VVQFRLFWAPKHSNAIRGGKMDVVEVLPNIYK